jgi:hypothetical protein
MISKIKDFVKKNQGDILLFLAVFLGTMLSFSLGYIIAEIENKEPLNFEQKYDYRK